MKFEFFKVLCQYDYFEIFKVLGDEERHMKVFTKKEEQILLAIYHLKDEAYLIPIREKIKEFTGKYFSVGTIYVPLNRLHAHGYLTASTQKPDASTGGKPIKYYKLTERGLAALAALEKQNRLMWKGYKTPAF
jgi:DNA-binding PadR family transcriptional regulator